MLSGYARLGWVKLGQLSEWHIYGTQAMLLLEQNGETWRSTDKVREKLSSWELEDKVRENEREIRRKLQGIQIDPFGLENWTLGWFWKPQMRCLNWTKILSYRYPVNSFS